jgi:hypothetical protein
MIQPSPQNIQPSGTQPTMREIILSEAAEQLAAGGRIPGTFTAQMMDKLFHCCLPKKKEEYDEYYIMMDAVFQAAPRIPNINHIEYSRLRRDWQDIREMAGSQGMERVVASMMQQHLYDMRLLVSRGDIPLPGLTGVSAIITTKQEQMLKMPQPKEPSSGGLFGFWRR